MDKVVREWREKHPKCMFCEYFFVREVGVERHTLLCCRAKEKLLNDFSIMVPRKFCKLYKVKEQ